MILDFYQQLPLNLSPIAFTVGSFSVRWYGLAYLAGFLGVYLTLLWRIKKGEAKNIFKFSDLQLKLGKNQTREFEKNILLDYLLVAFFAALLGGRLGYALIYNQTYFLANPLAVISPLSEVSGALVGFYGMSYHGALLGVLTASGFFLKYKKIDFWLWADFVAPAVALGYFFGRIGNFLNGELYGRVTNSPLGMYFLSDPAALRHPSQLYEALLEGVLLFGILWKMRQANFPRGTLLAAYLIGYGFFRTLAEVFRQPDPQLGFICGYLTLGQILSLLMVSAGVGIFFYRLKNSISRT